MNIEKPCNNASARKGIPPVQCGVIAPICYLFHALDGPSIYKHQRCPATRKQFTAAKYGNHFDNFFFSHQKKNEKKKNHVEKNMSGVVSLLHVREVSTIMNVNIIKRFLDCSRTDPPF